MYSKTSLGSDQLTGGLKLSRRAKWTLFSLLSLVILTVTGLGIWSAVGNDPYTTSANGCVSLTIPSSTGGATLHYCGAQAKSFCRSAFGSSDRISLLARPQCVLAGLTEAKVSAG
jgi:hypothetical protein